MAKPGSNGARQLAAQAQARHVDLTRAAMSDEQAAEVQELVEFQLGMRCSGCYRRLGLGFYFYSVDPKAERPVVKFAACTRDDCDFAEKCRDGGTVTEAVEFAWLDPAGLNARPAKIGKDKPIPLPT